MKVVSVVGIQWLAVAPGAGYTEPAFREDLGVLE